MWSRRAAFVAAIAAVIVAVAAQDYYEMLGVTRDATLKEIKRAYRKRALELHPDKLGPNITDAQEQAFIDLAHAYETLSDGDARARYDAFGPEDGGKKSVIVKSYHKFPFDMFVSVPGGAFTFHWKPAAMPKAPDITLSVSVTLEEVLTGTMKSLNVTRPRICPVCHGTGALSANHSHTCHICEGTGRHVYLNEFTGGYKHAINKTCEYCEGTGTQYDTPCEHCNGARISLETKLVEVTLPPGVEGGSKIRLSGGRQAIGHRDGSILVIVGLAPHPKFRLTNKLDLLYETRIGLIDSLVGFARNLTMLDGTVLEVVHDGDNVVTFSGYERRYEGLGIPKSKTPSERTDLVIKFTVVFPRRLSEEDRVLLGEIMGEEGIERVESVIRLAMARDAEIAGSRMKLEELKFSRACSASNPFVCLPDARTAFLSFLGIRC